MMRLADESEPEVDIEARAETYPWNRSSRLDKVVCMLNNTFSRQLGRISHLKLRIDCANITPVHDRKKQRLRFFKHTVPSRPSARRRINGVIHLWIAGHN